MAFHNIWQVSVGSLYESQRLFDYRQLQTSSLDTLVRRFHFNVSSLNSKDPLHTPNFQSTPQESHHVPQRWFVRVRRPKPSLTLERESKTDSMGRNNQCRKSRKNRVINRPPWLPILYMNFGPPPLFILAGHTWLLYSIIASEQIKQNGLCSVV